MHEDAALSQISQQDRELEVNATELVGSPVPHKHFVFGLEMTVDGAATAYLSYSVSPESVSP